MALRRDSALLIAVDPVYHRLHVLDTVVVRDGGFVSTGFIDGDHAAFLKWNNIDEPFYLVLGEGEQHLDIGLVSWRTRGNRQQAAYAAFLTAYRQMSARRQALREEYCRRLADSTLTADLETSLVERDSLLADSARHLMQAARSRRDCVGDIVRSRFPR